MDGEGAIIIADRGCIGRSDADGLSDSGCCEDETHEYEVNIFHSDAGFKTG
jgi:hypothetical protein